MAAPAIGIRGRTCPPQSARIDWSHPAAVGLLWSSHSGHWRNDVTLGTPTRTGDPAHAATAVGHAAYCTGGDTISMPMKRLTGAGAVGAVSFRCIVRITSWPGDYCCLVDKGLSNARDLFIGFNTAGNLNYVEIYGLYEDAVKTVGLTVGPTWDFVATITAAGAAIYYVNGVQVSTGSVVNSSGGAPATTDFGFGGNLSGSAVAADASYSLVQLWERVLSPGDVAALAANPFVVYRS